MAGLTPPGWATVYRTALPQKNAELALVASLDLQPRVREWVQKRFSSGVYRHQAAAIAALLERQNVCLTTGTASGKSLAFQVAALELLARDRNARVIAIYPMKALGVEQESRWRACLAEAGIPGEVTRVDGSVQIGVERMRRLRTGRVVVMTPDIIHAWLLARLSEKPVRDFLGSISLVVVDEIHTYTGVFGSNAGLLFRRLQHAFVATGARPHFCCASATVRDPAEHLRNLLGQDFTIIGPELDTSPRHEVTIDCVQPPGADDFLTEIVRLLRHLISNTDVRFLAFVESRKQTETITTILNRAATPDGVEDDVLPDDIGETPSIFDSAEVLPYRAGIESSDREEIQRRLSEGGLRGVVSTSALELGIDLPELDCCVLIGVPRSSTSLWQRIGRIGRKGRGNVVIVNSGDVSDEALFRRPATILSRPPSESTLYLENRRIQYIHAMCMAGPGGEDESLGGSAAKGLIETGVDWPPGFLDLCQAERNGAIPEDLYPLKSEAGAGPHHAYPLRDVERQFQVELRQGPNQQRLGTLSFSQALREAYPGAIYYYVTKPYRIYSVSVNDRKILARLGPGVFTRPRKIPTLVRPNLSSSAVIQGMSQSELRTVECAVSVTESVSGVHQKSGKTETVYDYPLDGTAPLKGVYWRGQWFTRSYQTSGVLILHPALSTLGAEIEWLAEVVFQALLLVVPFDRQDLGFACGKTAIAWADSPIGSRFIAIFDQTYGSLRLSSRLLERGVLSRVLDSALEIANASEPDEEEQIGVIRAAIEKLRTAAAHEGVTLTNGGLPTMVAPTIVIMPSSVGLAAAAGRKFTVDSVFHHHQLGLAYRGRYDGEKSKQIHTIKVETLVEIPGETRLGAYDLDTGELSALDAPA